MTPNINWVTDYVSSIFKRPRLGSDPNRIHPLPQPASVASNSAQLEEVIARLEQVGAVTTTTPSNTSPGVYTQKDVEAARIDGIVTGATAGMAAGTVASVGNAAVGVAAGGAVVAPVAYSAGASVNPHLQKAAKFAIRVGRNTTLGAIAGIVATTMTTLQYPCIISDCTSRLTITKPTNCLY